MKEKLSEGKEDVIIQNAQGRPLFTDPWERKPKFGPAVSAATVKRVEGWVTVSMKQKAPFYRWEYWWTEKVIQLINPGHCISIHDCLTLRLMPFSISSVAFVYTQMPRCEWTQSETSKDIKVKACLPENFFICWKLIFAQFCDLGQIWGCRTASSLGWQLAASLLPHFICWSKSQGWTRFMGKDSTSWEQLLQNHIVQGVDTGGHEQLLWFLYLICYNFSLWNGDSNNTFYFIGRLWKLYEIIWMLPGT